MSYFVERCRVYQNHGDIPSTVTLIDRTTDKEVAARPPKPSFGRKVAEFVQGAFWLAFIVASAAVAYPLYVGGGSLAAAVAPLLVDIAPDAAAVAVSRHPEWTFGTKIKVTAYAETLKAMPAGVTTALLGGSTNTTGSLELVLMFWPLKIAKRPDQVEFMAKFIESQIEQSQQ